SALFVRMRTDCAEIWAALADERVFSGRIALRRPVSVLVWRQDLQPRFRTLAPAEARALTLAMRRASFAEICAAAKVANPAQAVGAMLGRWIVDGLIADVAPA
ncbi:MAG: DNA-binding domain-containing protein, partial [Novosphingobium sp.]